MWMLAFELRILRGVRVVALSAVHDRRLDVQVGLAERRARRVVAFEARGLNRLDQQGILGRGMRLVASQAVSCRRLVGLVLLHPGLQVLVAGHAEPRALSAGKAP